MAGIRTPYALAHLASLHLAIGREKPDRGLAWLFRTGLPVTFHALRNTAPAPKLRRGAVDAYQQKIEPAGRYLLADTAWGHHEDRGPAPGWVTFVQRFACPLVLLWSSATRHGDERHGGYGEHSWKAELARAFHAKGAGLSAALRRDGFDGVVTVRDGSTSEIVALVALPCR